MGGISYTSDGIAESVVVSGGYKDDEDFGDRIIYTGHGGQDAPGGRQIIDQKMERGNKALANSQLNRTPVRLIRGSGGDPKFSPKSGYRYEGLYQVTGHWFETSRDGPLVIRFELIQIAGPPPIGNSSEEDDGIPAGQSNPKRRASSGLSIVRDPKVASWIKKTYSSTCQNCRIVLSTPAGLYSVGAHIRALGTPHNGKDVVENVLSLCPNCHVLFDYGAIYIEADCKTVVTVDGGGRKELLTSPKHVIDEESVAYHRLHIAGNHM
jgi:putative restriction endonuclease